MGSPKIAKSPTSATSALADPRAALAARFIPAGARVLEIAGSSLRPHMPFGAVHRAGQIETPYKADLVARLDPFETQSEAENALGLLASRGVPLLIGADTDLDDNSIRGTDEFTFLDLVRTIDSAGLRIQSTATLNDSLMILRLTPTRNAAAVRPCSVALISGGLTFAERLGAQMIQSLLPGEADVHHIHLGDLAAARGVYDLVVLGVGQGLFNSLFDEKVLAIVKSAPSAIGIFGTQQRDLIPRKPFERLLDQLDTWYARHEEDVLLYGRERNNVVHLGDWIMTQFPLGQARDQELLTIGEEAVRDLPLDRAIQAIQRHRAVFSHAPAPFLCALTTADTVAYGAEENADEFRGLLTDIFGCSYPEREFFQVEREAVMRYRARVHRNVAEMRSKIASLLGAKAAA
ncbi:MAG: hypothetical protein JO254_15390 [Pseudolabrys sp.]|nr:hypothetical protein [Pseudolabrys sp.]